MKIFLPLLSSIPSLCVFALASASGATFVPGDVFSLAGNAPQSYPVINITGGGDFSGSPGLAVIVGAQATQMAWSADLTTLYVTKYMTVPNGAKIRSVWDVNSWVDEVREVRCGDSRGCSCGDGVWRREL